MKHTTKLPILIGILSIIAIFLMAFNCDKPKPGDDKAKKADAITLSDTVLAAANTGGVASLLRKTDGGADGKQVYWTVDVGANKFIKIDDTKITSISKSKKFTYDVTDEDGKPFNTANKIAQIDNGKIKLLGSKKGFVYLVVKSAGNKQYKPATKKILILVGAVPTKAQYLATPVKLLPHNTNSVANNVVDVSKKTEITIASGRTDNKQFKLSVELQYKAADGKGSGLPFEAPKSQVTLSLKGNSDPTVDSPTASASENSVVLLVTSTGNEEILRAEFAVPYSTDKFDFLPIKLK